MKTPAWCNASLIAITLTAMAILGVPSQAQETSTDQRGSNHAGHMGHDSAAMGQMSGSKPACQDASLACARAATPAFATDGSLWVVWSGGGAVSVSRSTDLGKSFAPAIEIAKHDRFLDTGPDARPSIVIDRHNRMAIAYAFFKDNQWNAQANIATSIDSGQSFELAHPIVLDAASQRFPSLVLTPEGELFAIWIDKRLVAEAKRQGKPAEGGSIAYAWSSDMGQTFKREEISEPSSCECCRIALGLSPRGLPVVAYRANFEGTTRDHAVQIFQTPSQPGRPHPISDDHWVTNSCPHHGPTIAVSANGTLHTAWFTQGSNRVGTFYARSTDQGKHFSPPMQLGSPDQLSGRPYVLALGNAIWLVWKNFDGQHATIWMQSSQDDGQTWAAPKQIAQAVGYTDHPLLVAQGQKVYLSWLTTSVGYQLLEIER